MITIKETGTQYREINQNVIDWAIRHKKTIAWVERPLKYSGKEEPEYKDDVMPAEVQEGIRKVRAYLYREESDPIYMKWQRGEATEKEWLDAIAAIKKAWPYLGKKK